MSYSLVVNGELIDQLATNYGLYQISNRYWEQDTPLGRFFRDGESNTPGRLRESIQEALENEKQLPEEERFTAILSFLLRSIPKGTRGKVMIVM